jgi:predicted  nucleic acid-binding Zn-ribbon protein
MTDDTSQPSQTTDGRPDLVTLLREWFANMQRISGDDKHPADMLREAADEIERLRADKEALSEQIELVQTEIGRLNDYVRHVETERDTALRRALSH